MQRWWRLERSRRRRGQRPRGRSPSTEQRPAPRHRGRSGWPAPGTPPASPRWSPPPATAPRRARTRWTARRWWRATLGARQWRCTCGSGVRHMPAERLRRCASELESRAHLHRTRSQVAPPPGAPQPWRLSPASPTPRLRRLAARFGALLVLCRGRAEVRALSEPLRHRLHLEEQPKVIRPARLGVRPRHVEPAEWLDPYEGARDLAVQIEIAHPEFRAVPVPACRDPARRPRRSAHIRSRWRSRGPGRSRRPG